MGWKLRVVSTEGLKGFGFAGRRFWTCPGLGWLQLCRSSRNVFFSGTSSLASHDGLYGTLPVPGAFCVVICVLRSLHFNNPCLYNIPWLQHLARLQLSSYRATAAAIATPGLQRGPKLHAYRLWPPAWRLGARLRRADEEASAAAAAWRAGVLLRPRRSCQNSQVEPCPKLPSFKLQRKTRKRFRNVTAKD